MALLLRPLTRAIAVNRKLSSQCAVPIHQCHTRWSSSSKQREQLPKYDLIPDSNLSTFADDGDDENEPLTSEPIDLNKSKQVIPHNELWNYNYERFRNYLEQQQQQQQQQQTNTTSKQQQRGAMTPATLPIDLHYWLSRQRNLYNRKVQGHVTDILSDDRQDLLQSLLDQYNHVGLQPRRDFWNKRFMQLQAFMKRHDCFPYDMNVDELNDEEQKLWYWCAKQRQHYKIYQTNRQRMEQRGESDEEFADDDAVEDDIDDDEDNHAVSQGELDYTSMTQERIERLDSIGFVWNQYHDKWESNYKMLKEYYDMHLNTLVPEDYVVNPSFGRWVNDQRHYYKLYQQKDPRSPMTPERIRRLEELEFSWNAFDTRWLLKYEELQAFMSLAGAKGVIPSAKENSALRGWCVRQRKFWRDKREGLQTPLTDEREAKLNELKFPWR